MTRKNTTNISLIVSIIALIASVVLSIFLYMFSQQVRDIRKDSYINTAQFSYDNAKLQFCVKNVLAPCDDPTIAAWNVSNPDDNFSLRNFQDIVEEGINQYTASGTR